MIVGLLSDTHRRTDLAEAAIMHLVRQGAQALVHAGDVVDARVLELMKQSGLPYVAVFGNNDAHLLGHAATHAIYPEPHRFAFQETRFKLMHLPYYLTPEDADVVVFGHSHHFESRCEGRALFVNPGEVCAREKPLSECAILRRSTSGWEVSHWFCSVSSMQWDVQVHAHDL